MDRFRLIDTPPGCRPPDPPEAPSARLPTALAALAGLILTLATAPAQAQDAVGINAHLAPDDVYDLAQALGVGFVRIDNNWFTHEPADGLYDWAELDRAVDRIVSHGQSVFMTIAYAPAWALESGEVPSGVPRDGLYARYVSAVVQRYHDRVQHFGLWNEANLGGFWSGTADQYSDRIVRAGADAIHAACPTCKAVGPELAGVGEWQHFLEAVFQRAGDHLDIISHHTYAKPGSVVSGWICDDLEHALDSGADALCFYKPGLRQVLDEFDSVRRKEVWLTETGYRADPWDDPAQQRRQADIVRATLDDQLATPWWTLTAFYELVDCRPTQPDCDIDGFGLARRLSGPDDSAGDNFLKKPAFLALRDRLIQDPGFHGVAPPPPAPRPPREVTAKPHAEGPPDGDLGDFHPESCVILPDYVALTAPRTGDDDLWVQLCAGWSADALYLGIDTVDAVQDNRQDDTTLWLGDSIQVAVDVRDDGRAADPPGYGPDDAEIDVALVGGTAHTHESPGTMPVQAAARREGNHTLTEVRIGWPGRAAGQRLHLSVLVNDADGNGREGFLEWTPGIGREKHPGDFGYVVLAGGDVAPGTDAGTAGDATPTPGDAIRPTEDDAAPVGPHETLDGGVAGDADARPGSIPDGGAAHAKSEAIRCQGMPGRSGGLGLWAVVLLGVCRRRRRRVT